MKNKNKKENMFQDITLTIAVIIACCIMGQIYNEDLNFLHIYTAKDYFLYSCGLFIIIKIVYNTVMHIHRALVNSGDNKG